MLASLICGSAGAASLDYWLSLPKDKRELLRELEREHGALDSGTLSLVASLLEAGETAPEIAGRVRAHLLEVAAAAEEEEARRRHGDGDSPSP